LPVAMLACTRIGAVHSIVFGAFSAESLRDRINDSACKVLITQDTGVRGTRQDIPMKANADKAVSECPSIEKVIVVQRTGQSVEMESGRDAYWHELMAGAEPWRQKTRCTFCTPPAPQANPRVCCTQPAVIWFMPPTHTN